MRKEIAELTLILMYLTSWNEEGYFENAKGKIERSTFKCAWKGYDFDVLNELTIKGLLFDSNYKNKSVTLTKKGELLAEELIKKYIKNEDCIWRQIWRKNTK